LLGTITSCFNPDLTGVTVTCDPPLTGACPDQQQCNSAGTCVPTGNTNSDMATTATLTPSEGCPLAGTNPGLGFDVTASGKPTVYACPVKFTNKTGQTADAQCKAPYVLCTSATNIDLAACSKAGLFMQGYFISAVVANKRFGGSGSGQTACGAPGNQQIALWSGCGRTTSSVSTVACAGFATALDCSFTSGSFQCQGSKIGDAINTDGASGVLCCKP
jgi:hypothetical protein